MKTKTLALTAFAALALPGAATAAKPEDPGAKGKEKAAATKGAEKSAAAKDKAKKAKGKAFTLKGVGLTALPVADGALTGELTLDPTSANKHARTLLELSKDDLGGTATETFGVTGDEVVVKYVGLSETDALQPTDRVKVLGKVVGGELDIRKIKVARTSDDES